MGEEKSKSRGWCGWFIALIVLAAVVLAVVYMVKSKMKKNDDGAGPVPGPPGAIDKKYADALKLSLQFFDIQKSGKLVDNKISWRGDSGLKDGSEANLDLSKGLYDAGDHIKFGFPMAFTATVLSWSILEYGDQMDVVNQLDPAKESLRWTTDYFINAHPSDNVLYIQVGDPEVDHPCWERPETMKQKRPLIKIDADTPGTEVAAETAAAMASASLVFKDSDPQYSATLLKHAKQLFDFADTKRGSYSVNIPKVQRNLAELGFKEPTPIQRQAIPVLLSGRECFACAPTGSGKTFAFICPMLIKLKRHSTDGIRAVILSPARELAAQTAREGKKLTKGSKFNIRLMTKPLAKTADFSKLQCDVLISTPMRLKRAIKAKKIDLSKVEYLVLDESDKLFEQSMLKQIDGVVKACSNPSIIRSLFSATLPDSVEELARSIMHDAVRVIIGRKNTASETVKQKLVFAGTEEGKLLALRQSFAQSLNPPVLIFLQSKERAKELYDELKCDNIRVGVIHSDLPPGERENAVDSFRAGETWVLIATDVIARGMDFKGINCVINYDFPDSASAYIHRIGRSGRAGRSGEAITFYTEEDVPFLRNIANTMTSSGCEVPSWIMTLKKKKWKKHRPKRDAISTRPKESKTEEEE